MTIDPRDELIETFASMMVSVVGRHAKHSYDTDQFKLLY